MTRVYAYEKHDGFPSDMYIADHRKTSFERYCPLCEDWDTEIGEVTSENELLRILNEHDISEEKEEYSLLIAKYHQFSEPSYKTEDRKKDLDVGLFFYINGEFAFYGCDLNLAEKYGDFLIYPESHLDVWDRLHSIPFMRDGSFEVNHTRIDYDYFPRGRIAYNSSTDTFLIYYDACIGDQINQIAEIYKGHNVTLLHDEHYCCHSCNSNYIE